MEQLLSHPTVSQALSNYPKSQWMRVLTAFLLHGIHAIRRHYHISELGVDDLEALCGGSYRGPMLKNDIVEQQKMKNENKKSDIKSFMKELTMIRHEISRLDRKIETNNKENECPNNLYVETAKNIKAKPISEFNEPKRSISQPAKQVEKPQLFVAERPRIATRASSAWRTKKQKCGIKKGVRSLSPVYNEPRGRERIIAQIRETDKNNAAMARRYDRARVKNMIPTIRAACKTTNPNIRQRAYRQSAKNRQNKPRVVPEYLRTVQSRIKNELDQDKRNYRLKKEQEPLRASGEMYRKPQIYNVPQEYMYQQKEEEEQKINDDQEQIEEQNIEPENTQPQEILQPQEIPQNLPANSPSAYSPGPEEPELPTLGRGEGHFMDVADQCLGSSIINHFTRTNDSKQLQDIKEYQYKPPYQIEQNEYYKSKEPEESARFKDSADFPNNPTHQISMKVQQEPYRAIYAKGIKTVLPSQDLREMPMDTNAENYNMGGPSRVSNDGRIPHYSETALMPDQNIPRKNIPMTTSVDTDQRYQGPSIHNYGYFSNCKLKKKRKNVGARKK